MSDERESYPSDVRAPVTRRKFIGRSAAAGAALSATGLLAACGSNNKSSGSSAATTTAAPAASDVGAQLQKILGEPKNLLAKGPGTFKMAAQLALTGQGAIYGELQGEGFRYGIKHVEAWTNGKLKLNSKFYDNKSGVPQAEAAAGRQAGLLKVPVFLQSYIFGFGAVVPFAKQYKMFSPDPGGGAGPVPGPFAGQPYCYGFRAGWPTDVLEGVFKYLRETFPDKKRWALVQATIAPPYNNAVQTYVKNLYKKYNCVDAGQVLAPLGATNYSSVIQKVKGLNPDVVVYLTFGTDTPYQAKEAVRQGLNVISVGADHQATTAKVGGSALKGWYFSQDDINTQSPPSDWGKFFVQQFEKDHNGLVPSFYHAGDYITTFAIARLMDDILGAGGDIHDGDAYIKALEANPEFNHVYGGDGATLGKIVIDTKTHSPSAIPMILFQSQGTGDVKDVKQLASYNIGAKDYKKIA